MKTVYRLRNNQPHVANVQKATLTTAEYGIEPTHGLFGSPEWWAQIEDGRLAVRTIRGTITRAYMSGHNDWPEFEMQSESGQLLRWTREVNQLEDDHLYLPGNKVEIDVVTQRHRPASWDHGAETEVVLEIRVSDAA